jgi:hypothetical protein
MGIHPDKLNFLFKVNAARQLHAIKEEERNEKKSKETKKKPTKKPKKP